jgi:hypothetical protein
MRFVVLSAALMLAASPVYAAQTATVESETPAAEAKPKTRTVCRREHDANSRLGKKVCKTLPVEAKADETATPAPTVEAQAEARNAPAS